jgi:hypothetical protein
VEREKGKTRVTGGGEQEGAEDTEANKRNDRTKHQGEDLKTPRERRKNQQEKG